MFTELPSQRISKYKYSNNAKQSYMIDTTHSPLIKGGQTNTFKNNYRGYLQTEP